MKYYFVTAGSHHQQDYRWWKVSDEKDQSHEVTLSDIPTIKELELNKWLDGDSSGISLILGRRDTNQSELLLFITNLPTKRQDYQRRTIRNSLLCIAESSTEYTSLRQLASAVLSNAQIVADALDVSLNEDSEISGFTFDSSAWIKFLNSEKIVEQHQPISKKQLLADGWNKLHFRIAKDSPERRKEVSSYLLSGIELPEKLDVIFLLTRYKESRFYDEHPDSIGAVLSELEDKEQWRYKGKKTFLKKAENFIRNIEHPFKRHLIAATVFVALILLLPALFPALEKYFCNSYECKLTKLKKDGIDYMINLHAR